jgi:hypothetical protein
MSFLLGLGCGKVRLPLMNADTTMHGVRTEKAFRRRKHEPLMTLRQAICGQGFCRISAPQTQKEPLSSKIFFAAFMLFAA